MSLGLWPASAQMVAAMHSLPSPTPIYQSASNNGVPTAATIVRPAGLASGWTTARLDGLDVAADEWRVDSDFGPTLNRTVSSGNACFDSLTCHGVWIDGYDPFLDLTDENIYAINYVYSVFRTDPADNTKYYDIEDWDVLFNTAGVGHPTFTYSAAGSSDPDVIDFRGVATHELGHAIQLKDLYDSACHYGTNMETMCGAFDGVESTRLRSIQSDDISGANLVY